MAAASVQPVPPHPEGCPPDLFQRKAGGGGIFLFSVFLWDKPFFHAGFRHMNEEIIADMFCAAARYGTETYSSTLKEDAFL